MRIEKEMKLADVIHHDFNLIPVINRFGIQLGFGDQTIEQICTEKGVNTAFFLTIVNTYHDPHYFPKKHMQSFPANSLIDYLQKAHQYYLEQKMPEIKKLISRLTEVSGERHKENFRLALNFFEEYQQELTAHIEREETLVYPYVVELENVVETGAPAEKTLAKMNTYSITDYEEEHENVEEKLFDLTNLIIKYLPSVQNDTISYKILLELSDLERDLREHARIEDMILVPKVEAMEFALKKLQQ